MWRNEDFTSRLSNDCITKAFLFVVQGNMKQGLDVRDVQIYENIGPFRILAL